MPDPAIPLWHDLRWIVTTAFALWGAGLSSYQLVLKLRERRPIIRVFLGHAHSMVDNRQHDFLRVSVLNVGQLDVHIKPDSVLLQGDGATTCAGLPEESYRGLVSRLQPGDSFTLEVSRSAAVEVLFSRGQRVKAILRDALGREYCSDWREDDRLDLIGTSALLNRQLST